MKKLFQFLSILLLVFPAIVHGECIEGDCANGYGVYIFPEGGEYSGQFDAGEFSQGKQVFADGNRYEGTFVNSTPHGEGTLTYLDGSVYKGQFDMGAITGKGTILFSNQSKYEGDFVNGQFQGTGTFTYSDGSQYVGEFKSGQMDGKGTLYSDGRVYKGEFKKGEHYGKGTITYFDRSQEIGEWKDGKFVVKQQIKAPPKKKPEEGNLFGSENFAIKDPWAPEQNEAFGDKQLFQPPQWETGQKQNDLFFQGSPAEENKAAQ